MANIYVSEQDREMYRLLTLKACLKLELAGMRHSRGAIGPIVRKVIGSKTRDKGKLYNELLEYIEEAQPQTEEEALALK
jgi:hypothetical protein